jgi:hypothetical protein
MTAPADFPELGQDDIEASTGTPRWLPRRRLALGSRLTATPLWIFILAGVGLGPSGLDLLTPRVFDQVQGAAWVALAVLGVFLGLGFAGKPDGRPTAGLAVPAGAAAGITIVTIGAGAWWLIGRQTGGESTALLAGLIGLCLSISAAPFSRPQASTGARRASRIADLDDIPVIVLGAAAVALIAGPNMWVRLLATAGASGAIGLSGWLLFERASDTERGLFMTGIVLLLAGIGAYLGTSPLFSGCVAGIVWVRVPGTADRVTARDLRVLHHPLLVFLLILAGAEIAWSGPVVWLAAGLFALRVIAKIAASFATARVVGVGPGALASILLPPGVVGIALAINVLLLTGDTHRWLVSSVTIATLLSDALGLFLPDDAEAPA